MSTLGDYLNKPHYLFRPAQALRRMRYYFLRSSPNDFSTVTLPWGRAIRFHTGDGIGQALRHTGVFEMPVSEALWRLTDPGETCYDVGANIGYMSSILATRGALVVAFEPHPEVFEELRQNIARWPGLSIEARPLAMSRNQGTAFLTWASRTFNANRGTASLQGERAEDLGTEVRTATLDDTLGTLGTIGVLKVDVEGHEEAVFQGAHRALAEGRIRDILFEANEGYPSPVSRMLEGYGYVTFSIEKLLFRPRLARATPRMTMPRWEAPSLLATRDPERAQRRFRPGGWQMLR